MRYLWPFKSIYQSIEATFCHLNEYYMPFIDTKLEQRRRLRSAQQEGNESKAELMAEEEDFLDCFLNADDKYANVRQNPASDELRWKICNPSKNTIKNSKYIIPTF